MSVRITHAGEWNLHLFFKTDAATVSADYKVNVQPGAVLSSASSFNCPLTVFTSGNVQCNLQLRDVYTNGINATNDHILNTLLEVTSTPKSTLFYNIVLNDKTDPYQIQVVVQAPASEVTLSVKIQDTTTLPVKMFGGDAGKLFFVSFFLFLFFQLETQLFCFISFFSRIDQNNSSQASSNLSHTINSILQ